MMKKHSNAAITILVHQDDKVPWNVIKVSIVPLIKTPKRLPITFPTPPVNKVPPITAAAMASISNPFACSTNPPVVFRQNTKPAKAARKPLSTYTFNLVRLTLSPISNADCSFPPTA